MTHRATRRAESGFAIVTAVIVCIVIAIVVGAVVTASVGAGHDVARSSQRVDGGTIAESGIQAIQQALKALPDERGDGFSLDAAEVAAIAAASDGTVVAPSRVCPGNPSIATFAVRGTANPDGTAPYWQIMDWLRSPVTSASSASTIYVCGWRQGADANSATSVQVVRGRLRPGSFADYQVLSDAAIRFEGGTTINGQVHTNGFLDGTVMPPPGDDRLRVWNSPGSSVRCSRFGTTLPGVSAAKGAIRLTGATSDCRFHEYTGSYVNLGLAADTFSRMVANAGPSVRLFIDPSRPKLDVATRTAAATDPTVQVQRAYYIVDLQTTWATVRSPDSSGGYTFQTVPMPVDGTLSMLFNRDVYVRGTARGRVTIAAYANREANVQAPNIMVWGNLDTVRPALAPGGANSLGLVAEGSIHVGASLPSAWSCIRRIDAAMTAMTGGVLLPEYLRTQTYSGRPAGFTGAWPARCTAPLDMTGSMASHVPTQLRWSWGSAGSTGYERRSYRWNQFLTRFPPPYYPVTDTWEITHQETANADCYATAASPRVPATPRCL